MEVRMIVPDPINKQQKGGFSAQCYLSSKSPKHCVPCKQQVKRESTEFTFSVLFLRHSLSSTCLCLMREQCSFSFTANNIEKLQVSKAARPFQDKDTTRANEFQKGRATEY